MCVWLIGCCHQQLPSTEFLPDVGFYLFISLFIIELLQVANWFLLPTRNILGGHERCEIWTRDTIYLVFVCVLSLVFGWQCQAYLVFSGSWIHIHTIWCAWQTNFFFFYTCPLRGSVVMRFHSFSIVFIWQTHKNLWMKAAILLI